MANVTRFYGTSTTASKRTLLPDFTDDAENQPPAKRRGGGRPKGSKNKKTIAREEATPANR